MNFDIVAEGLNFPEGPLVLDDGQLIVCEVAGGRLMRIARDGKLSVFAETGGSPSGLAVGPDSAIYCCNNGGFDWDSAPKIPTRTRPLPDSSRTSGGGMIQRIDAATGRVEVFVDSFEGRRLAGPNDLQFTADGGFWFSDFGGWVDDGLRHGGLYRVEADGSVRRSNFGLCLNGVGVSPDGKTVYAAATYERWVLKFDASAEARRAGWRGDSRFPAPPVPRFAGDGGGWHGRGCRLHGESRDHAGQSGDRRGRSRPDARRDHHQHRLRRRRHARRLSQLFPWRHDRPLPLAGAGLAVAVQSVID